MGSMRSSRQSRLQHGGLMQNEAGWVLEFWDLCFCLYTLKLLCHHSCVGAPLSLCCAM